ncbi:hypothetical protein J7X08_000551 [Vibrio vulnificus]|uniref:hypothetical protein n=1 Tax=Vibrio vulnificus TaxID=672 RepID=UPI001DD17EF1|nr:hypothetical protein [Vibrio vulnificus]EHH2471556.1 hypothetical protein [Vibrio vulnificus]
MVIDKFNFEQIGWNGSLESILGLFSDLICYRLDLKPKPPAKYIELKSELESSDILSEWQRSSPDTSELPVFQLFQKKYQTFDNDAFTALDMEIQGKGLLLAKGQILFRGVCFENQNDDWSNPISTTLSPYIAIDHAVKNGHTKPIKIYVIEVPFDSGLKAIIGPFGESVDFGQEYEVLVNFQCRPKVSEEREIGNVTLQLLRW